MQEKEWGTSILKKPITRLKMADMKELKQKAVALEPVVRIGKAGLTETVVSEIKKHIEKKKLIKVKMLRTFVGTNDKKALAKEIADKTGSLLVHRVGYVIALAKK